MKLWKSPILYFGVLLIIALTAALAAPYVVDWSRYRTTIETYGSELAGRKVVVAGPISARVFPWPKLSLEDVRVANLPGATAPQFLTAERIDIKMALSGLLNGTILVEAIELTRPHISIERMATGSGNWRIVSSPNLVKTGLLEHLKLDQIKVHNGAISLADARRGGAAQIDSVEMALSSPALGGPWRIRGSGKYKDRPIEIGIDTGAYRPDTPFKFGFRIAPADGSGLSYSFDGENDGARVAGQLKIEPAPQLDGKADAEGGLRPLVFRAQAVSDFDTLELKKIEIAPREGEPGTNIVSGEAMVKLGEVIGVDAEFSASRFDLDAIAGARARSLLREGRGLALLESIVESMPEKLEARTELKIRSLVAGGETLDNVHLDVSVLDGALRIHELSAGMPGQSEGLFDGIFLTTDSGPQLAGDVALTSQNLREFVRWVWPEGSGWIGTHWTGSRGRLKLQTRVDLLPDKYRATEASFEIDDSRHTGSLSVTTGKEARTDLVLKSNLVDVDSFLSGGPLAGGGVAATKALMGPPAGSSTREWPRFSLALTADRLLLNGTEAQNTVVDIASTGASLDLRRIEIGKVGDAQLEISGLITETGAGASGRISTTIVASDPRGMARLLGMAGQEADPPWLSALGETNLGIVAELKPDPSGPQLLLDVKGKSGAYAISGSAAMAAGEDSPRKLDGSLVISAETSSALAKLAGFEPIASVESPGRLAISANGDLAEGLLADIQVDIYGARFGYRGKLQEVGGGFQGSGRGGFHTDSPEALLKAIGLSWPVTGIFSVESDIALEGGKIGLTGLAGVAGAERFSGALELNNGVVKGEITGGSLAITDVLAATLLPWTGGPPDLEGPFAQRLPFGLTGEVWLKPHKLAIAGGAEIDESQIGLTATDTSLEFAIFGKGKDRQEVSVNLVSRRDGEGRTIEGKMSMPGELGQLLKTIDGQPVASGTISVDASFRGAGRSLASALADLDGGGTYSLHDVAIERIDPAGFTSVAKAAASAEDIRKALATLTAGGLLKLPDTKGTVTATDGRVALLPLSVHGPDADIQVKPTADLAAGSLGLDVLVQLKAIADLPGMEIAYIGAPTSLVRAIDTTALESFLGLKVLRDGMSALERLQQEQIKALEEEERFRREDEERYQAYLAQRRELQMRQREIQVQRKMRAEEEKRAKEEAKRVRDEARKAKKKTPATETSASEPTTIGPVILVPPDPTYVPEANPWPFGGFMPTDSEQIQRLKDRQR